VPSPTEQIHFPLCRESLTKIVYFGENLSEPFQHSHLQRYGVVGSA
jgi:hypothetical protein